MMRTSIDVMCGVVAVLAVVGSLGAGGAFAAADASFSPTQRGKAATAALEVAGKRVGSAFCVSKDGLFIACEPFNQREDDARPLAIRLVFDDGFHPIRTAAATIVRRDRAAGLLLLNVEEPGKFVPLEPSEKTLQAGLATMVFGYPTNFDPLSPAASDSVATLALGEVGPPPKRAANRESPEFVVKQPANIGNLGGPVLDDEGKLLGVVVGADSDDAHTALPFSAVLELLKEPVVVVSPTAIPYRDRRRDVEFRIVAKTYGVAAKPKTASLELRSAGERRVVEATPIDGGWKAKLAPLAPLKEERIAKVDWLGQDRSQPRQQANVAGGEVTIAGRATSLHDLRRLEHRGDEWVVTFVDGRKQVAKVEGLASLQGVDGSVVDAAGATSVFITPAAGDPDRIEFRVLAERGGDSALARGELRLTGAPQPLPEEATFDPFAAPEDAIDFELAVDDRMEMRLTPGGLILTHRSGQRLDRANGVNAGATPLKINGRVWEPRWFRENSREDGADPNVPDESDIYPLPIGSDDWVLESLTGAEFGKAPTSESREPRGPTSFYRERDNFTLLIWDTAPGAGSYQGKLVRRRLSPEQLAERAKLGQRSFRVSARVDGEDVLKVYQDRAEWHHVKWGWPTKINLNGKNWDPRKDGNYINPAKDGAMPAGIVFRDVEFVRDDSRGWVLFRTFDDHFEIYVDDPPKGAREYNFMVRLPTPGK